MKIILTGSIAYDYIMKFPGYFKDHILPEHLDSISLSFLVDDMVRQRGGVAANIAYTLALLGAHPLLYSTAGQDFPDYGAKLAAVGVDVSGVKIIENKFTASFFVNTDKANAQIASFYTGAMADAADHSLLDLNLTADDLVVVSPNDPIAMGKYPLECKKMGVPYLYDPGQQIVRMDKADLKAGVLGAYALFVNEYEFELLQKHTGLTSEELIAVPRFTVVTLGKKGARVYADNTSVLVPIIDEAEVVDPTGVGDAFRAGFLRGFMQGFGWELCAQMGTVSAAYCLGYNGTQKHKFTMVEFINEFRKHFDDHGQLDAILKAN